MTFDNNFTNFSLNVTTFGVLIDNIEIDMSHDFGYHSGDNFGPKRIPELPKCVYLKTWLALHTYTRYSVEWYSIYESRSPAFN